MNEIENKLMILESLQEKELKVYERFYMVLEKQNSDFVAELNQPELLSDMVSEKKRMMSEIESIETELGPLRKEIAEKSATGAMASVGETTIRKIKEKDLRIIEMISRISKTEQVLTHKIKEQMERIKGRLTEMKQQESLNKRYEIGKISFDKEKIEPTQLDYIG